MLCRIFVPNIEWVTANINCTHTTLQKITESHCPEPLNWVKAVGSIIRHGTTEGTSTDSSSTPSKTMTKVGNDYAIRHFHRKYKFNCMEESNNSAGTKTRQRSTSRINPDNPCLLRQTWLRRNCLFVPRRIQAHSLLTQYNSCGNWVTHKSNTEDFALTHTA